VAKLHDISVPIRAGMHVYDGNPGFRLELVSSIAAGAHANVSRLDLGVHNGTHVDAPLHFIDGGVGTESLDLEMLIGPASVVDATAVSGDLDAEALGALAFRSHAMPEIESVVDQAKDHVVVEKEGAAADIVVHLDPTND
jgi:arylformamidase